MSVLRVAWLLASRQLRRSSVGTTALIVFIMAITFLNLVVASGILVGLVEGSSNAYKSQYSSDVLVTALSGERYIAQTKLVTRTLDALDDVDTYTVRYLSSGSVEADYQRSVGSSDEPDKVSAPLVGINPVQEHAITRLADYVVEGEYLEPDDDEVVMIGGNLVSRYFSGPESADVTLRDVQVGEKVLISVGGVSKEYKVKGIIKTKTEEVSRRVFFVDRELRKLLNRFDFSADEIAVRIVDPQSPEHVRDVLNKSGLESIALVRTSEESQGAFFVDIKNTFSLLGNAIGSVALVVAIITTFIVIFINAVTRKRQIGVLKGIGISPKAIELAYVMQSFAYAIAGSIVGLVLLYGVLQPYFVANPIDFPFSDGILVAPIGGTVLRLVIMVIGTLIAGYLPARLIVKKNTLDTILGR